MMRKQIYDIVRRGNDDSKINRGYNYFIAIISIISIIPLMFKESNVIFDTVELFCVYFLFADYVFRWMTYDYKTGRMGKKAKIAFLLYPISFSAILNFVSILPTLKLVPAGLRILRMLRIFTIIGYSKNMSYIINVFKKERKSLLSMLYIALGYIFVSALAMFSYEPNTFESFFDALYWATTALTTVGYGDIYPTSNVGQLISMVSSLFGIAIIALPAGTVTAGFVEETNKATREKEIKAEKIREAKEKEENRAEMEEIVQKAANLAAKEVEEALDKEAKNDE